MGKYNELLVNKEINFKNLLNNIEQNSPKNHSKESNSSMNRITKEDSILNDSIESSSSIEFLISEVILYYLFRKTSFFNSLLRPKI